MPLFAKPKTQEQILNICDLSKICGGTESLIFFPSIKKKKSVLPNLTKNKSEGMTQLEKRETILEPF